MKRGVNEAERAVPGSSAATVRKAFSLSMDAEIDRGNIRD